MSIAPYRGKCWQCGHDHGVAPLGDPDRLKLVQRIAEVEKQREEAFNAGKPQWISVEDRLPESNIWIVARNGNNRPFTCRLMTIHTELFRGESYIDADNLQRSPTHWSPLPPKQDDTDE